MGGRAPVDRDVRSKRTVWGAGLPGKIFLGGVTRLSHPPRPAGVRPARQANPKGTRRRNSLRAFRKSSFARLKRTSPIT